MSSENFKFDFSLDPFVNFQNYFKLVQIKGVPEHQTMTLATADQNGKPSCRIVYFKGFVRGGFSFYTNYLGHKGLDLSLNPYVCANFYWPHIDTQVRISGVVDKLKDSESDQYFWSRPRLSQLGAWASKQSQELKSFAEFQLIMNDVVARYPAGTTVPRPPHWGGYRIIPNEIEFWLGRGGRLHERYVYTRTGLIETNAQKLNVADLTDYEWRRSLKFP